MKPIAQIHSALPGLASAVSLMMIVSVGSAWGQTATDLVCSACVGTGDIAGFSVAAGKLSANSVTNPKIANGAVSTGKIAARAVNASRLATNSVTNPKIATGAVTRGKIANEAVNSAKIENGSVDAIDLAVNAQPAGADFADGNQELNLGAADVVVRSVTVTAPSAGVVIANAQLYIDFNNIDGSARCSLGSGNTLDTARHTVLSGGDGMANRFHAVGLTRGFDVPAGSFTVNLICDSTNAATEATDSLLTAIFVPQKL